MYAIQLRYGTSFVHQIFIICCAAPVQQLENCCVVVYCVDFSFIIVINILLKGYRMKMTARDPAIPLLVRSIKRLYSPLEYEENDSAPNFERDEKFKKAIKLASALPKGKLFQGFNEKHLKYACGLICYFMNVELEKLEETVKQAQKELNQHLVHYALSVALTHRKDALEKSIVLPSGVYTQPEMYFDLSEVLAKIFSQQRPSAEIGSEQKPVIIQQTFTGTDKDPEHKVAYFREDIGMSLHHWHWHLVYPYIYTASDPTNPYQTSEFVNKDRRGELFYYMHQQMLARFNLERFSNHLSRLKPLHDLREPVNEAYYPKFGHLSSSYRIGSRPRDVVFKNVERDDIKVHINDMELYRDRLLDAIDRGEVYELNPVTKETEKKKIDIVTGIDRLGNSIEAAESLSWNPDYYGKDGLHNMGHLLIAYSHDPDDRYQEEAGPMGYTQTSHTDPLFYRWHGYINQMFQRYKNTLPEYTADELKFDNVRITDFKVVPLKIDEESADEMEADGYVLKTFFEKDRVDISRVLTQLVPQREPSLPLPTILAEFFHLQHEEFKYEINVENKSGEDKTVVVRIFMAPRENEHGDKMSFNEQRDFFIEMDKFTYKVPANTSVTIERKSTDSSVTIPFDQIFFNYRNIDDPVQCAHDMDSINRSVYCGCGWPEYLLVGKGRPGAGLLCDLFAMVTDYQTDKVEGTELPLESGETCRACEKDAIAYCGKRNSKYPDLRPMGFPFDRNFSDKEKFPKPTYLDDFVIKYSNMRKVDVRIRHLEGPERDGVSILK